MGTAAASTAKTESERRGEVLEVLRSLLAEGREAEIVDLVRQLVAKNAELERRLARLGRRRSNEGVSREQLLLLLDGLVEEVGQEEEPRPEALVDADNALRSESGIDEPADVADEERRTRTPRRQPPLRKPPPAHLPRVDNPIPVPAEERPCPTCGQERLCIGHDVTEVIELVPAQVIVRVDRREKLACKACEEIVRAPVGDKVVSGGRLGARLVAELLVDKYDDGLPLHRQKQRLTRMGLEISVSTLADQVTWVTDLLSPVWRAAIAEVLSALVMHLDGTGLPVLDRTVKGGTRLGTLWGYVGGTDTAAYVYTSTGKKKGQRPGEMGPEAMLALRRGYTVADASNIFDTSFAREGIIECGCNTHARRYFRKALDAGDSRAALPLAAYKKLYQIEDEIRALDAEAKLAARQQRSKSVFEELLKWCEKYKPHEPPSSPLGEALRYILNHQVALGRFLEASEVPIDNSIVERLHVRAALSRKNYLFAGSDAGGDRAAIAYTVLACCRLAGVNPVEYLADVLPRLARRIRVLDVPDLLPARWKAKREAALAAA